MILPRTSDIKNIRNRVSTNNQIIQKIDSWLLDQSNIISLGKTMKILIHIKGLDVKGDITLYPDH